MLFSVLIFLLLGGIKKLSAAPPRTVSHTPLRRGVESTMGWYILELRFLVAVFIRSSASRDSFTS